MQGKRTPGLFEPHLHEDAIPGWIIMTIFLSIVGPPAILTILFVRYINSKQIRRNTVTVLVLGDIGRSPRMMYHSESFGRSGWETFMVGYGETEPIPALLTDPHIHIHHLATPPKVVKYFPWVLRAPIRIVYQVISVIYICIFKLPFFTEVIIVQNPPSIPILGLAQFISACTDAKLIIDWHNTGYSILALRTGPDSRLVQIATWFESTFGHRAWAHLFVTQALRDFLVKEWDLKGRFAVLHDRPPPHFKRTEPMIQHELFERLAPELLLLPPTTPIDPKSTRFTTFTSNLPTLRHDRPALLISSTSWTPDEDFTPLIEALDLYQRNKHTTPTLPNLVVLITGKGPLRSAFETILKKKQASWKDITVRCIFVAASDYPVLLGSADLGISLHSSSSGRDLPMKIVDMFGCRVPVLAKGFPCLQELVKDGKNGMIFEDGAELGRQMIDLLESFPKAQKLENLKSFFSEKPVRSARTPTPDDEWTTWDENWKSVMQRNVLVWRKKTE